jgi:hypothetical protein
MIVFDLQCASGHVFEGWFGSSASFDKQKANRQLICPICQDTGIAKAIMAPSVGKKGNQQPTTSHAAVVAEDVPTPGQIKEMIATVARMQSKMLENSEWVGKEFDNKARAMAAGAVEKVPIHGEATREQAESLIEDGIDVLPLPLPYISPDRRN